MSHTPEMDINKAAKFIIANAHMQLGGNNECAIPYMTGSPGIGKTAYINKIGKKTGFTVLPFHFSLIPVEEISGIPRFRELDINGKTVSGTEWSLPDIMTQIYDVASKNEKVLIFLDDYHMSSPSHLALGFEMFSSRKLRGYKIPDNCAFVIAGNDTVKSGAKQMFGAIVNRFAFYKVVPNFEFWERDYAIPNRINDKIITFLKNKVNRSYFLEEESTIEPWASPRAWSRLSTLLNAMEDISFSEEELMYNVYAHVGGHAASEFVAHYTIYSNTQMDKVFDDKLKINVPSSNMDMYIYAMAASNEYCNRLLNLDDEKKSSIKKKSIIDKMSEITIEIARMNIDISVAMLQNIQDISNSLKNRNISMREIVLNLPKLDKGVNQKINESLSEIIKQSVPTV